MITNKLVRLQGIKSSMAVRYSSANVRLLVLSFREYSAIIEELKTLEVGNNTMLLVNLQKLAYKISIIEQPGNTRGACRHYFREALIFFMVELDNLQRLLSGINTISSNGENA